jgi:hypothetical protein
MVNMLPGLLLRARLFFSATTQRFWTKAVASLVLVLLADQLFQGLSFGSTLGLFGGVLLFFVWALRVEPAGRIELTLIALAAGLCFALVQEPSLLAVTLLWGALATVVLMPTLNRLSDARLWAYKLGFFTILAPAKPVIDLFKLDKIGKRRPLRRGRTLVASMVLPVAALLVFTSLFIWANPLIEEAVSALNIEAWISGFTAERFVIWVVTATIVWALLRSIAIHVPDLPGGERSALGLLVQWLFAPAGVLVSLILLNMLFALQNGLDLAYLWAGEALPEGMTYAEYAHRGAYSLIVTALLAALFVLTALRPGSTLSESKPIRWLVYLWIGQNIFLVFSSILRTLYYVDAYSLTLLRISALIWMGLVALGLLFIIIRIRWKKTGLWLINVNTVSALAVLYACSFVDLSGIIARFNVAHSQELTGQGTPIDLDYLRELGPSSLPALNELIAQLPDGQTKTRASMLRGQLTIALVFQQRDWRRWTYHGHRLLAVRSWP